MSPWISIVAFAALLGCGDPPATTQAAARPSGAGQSSAAPEAKPLRGPDVVYVPTSQATVDAMLKLANVGTQDVLYDLGSGDGRIPITAAKRFGVRAVGIDIDPQRIREANAKAKSAGVSDRVTFRNEDLFQADFSEASVVTLYLLPELNLKLRPRLLRELKPGTRVVSHDFHMGDWTPEQTVNVGTDTIYLWTIPNREAR